MKRLLFLVALLLLSVTAAAWDLPALEKSVLRLKLQDKNGDGGTCSSVVFASGLALTAAHCVEGDDMALAIDGRDAKVKKVNRILDLAVVSFLHKDAIVLPLALKTPKGGSDLAVVGFAFAAAELTPTYGHVSVPRNADGNLVMNVDLIFGDSGGAVLDAKGRLIGINSAVRYSGPAHLGLAIPIETIRDFIDEFLPKPTK